MGENTPVVDVGGFCSSISIGGQTACCILNTGALVCWGANGNGQLLDGSTDNRGDAPDEMPPPEVNTGDLKAIAVSVAPTFL